jgi:hypothetical protein
MAFGLAVVRSNSLLPRLRTAIQRLLECMAAYQRWNRIGIALDVLDWNYDPTIALNLS